MVLGTCLTGFQIWDAACQDWWDGWWPEFRADGGVVIRTLSKSAAAHARHRAVFIEGDLFYMLCVSGF